MERILLLEDDKSLVTGLTLALGRAGYALDTARTLAEANRLWQCPSQQPSTNSDKQKTSAGALPFAGMLPALLGVTQSSTGMSSPNSSGRNRGQTFSVMEITEAARRLPISQEAGRFLP